MNKVYRRTGTFIVILLMLFAIGCQKEEGTSAKDSFSSIYEQLGQITQLRDTEGDYYYLVESETDIKAVFELIRDSVEKEHKPKDSDILSPPPGAPTDAATLRFYGDGGKELSMYVDNKELSYELVCHLYTSSMERSTYCFSLEKKVYKEIKDIVHVGEKHKLNE